MFRRLHQIGDLRHSTRCTGRSGDGTVGGLTLTEVVVVGEICRKDGFDGVREVFRDTCVVQFALEGQGIGAVRVVGVFDGEIRQILRERNAGGSGALCVVGVRDLTAVEIFIRSAIVHLQEGVEQGFLGVTGGAVVNGDVRSNYDETKMNNLKPF